MKKSQAALEYLTTYGWAFLIIVSVVWALFQFGVINPKAWKQEECWFDAGIACKEYWAKDKYVEIDLVNQFRQDITVNGGFIDAQWKGGRCNSTDYCDPKDHTICGLKDQSPWSSGSRRHVKMKCPDMPIGAAMTLDMTIIYRTDFGRYDKTVSGKAEFKVR